MSAQRPSIAVFGLGLMGGAVAANIHRAGHAVQGYDPDPNASRRAGAGGIDVLADPTALDAATTIVLTSLPSAGALHATVDVLATRLARSAVVVELSTLSIDDKERARAVLAAAGIDMLDCPISGTGAQAVDADLSVYASGAPEAWNRVSGVVAAFARRPRFVGEFGAGTRLKLIANLLVAIHNVACAEAMAMAEAAGIDLALATDVLREGAGNSRIFELRAPLMASGRYQPATMKLDVWAKDMALIEAFARDHGVQTTLFDGTRATYDAAREAGPDDDTAAVFEIVRRRRR